MKYGEIWFVQFGELDQNDKNVQLHEYYKNRPALIIESNRQLLVTSVITIIPLTSQKNNNNDDIIIKKDDNNNLNYDSILKVQHIYSIDKSKFIKKIGEVDKESLIKVGEYLKRHFGL